MANLLRRFPLQVMLGALVIYGLTVSHGVTSDSLVLTAKVAGWDWQPMSDRPLVWLFTLPLRLLPAGWVAMGMNLFSMACGVVTLGIMARSLELLPWSRPLTTLGGWRARLPLLLPVAICGLEFNFWRAATVATGEMLDLLFLAAAIWCLLEYHAGKNARWLNASAVIWGAGMTENWAMLLALPFFIVALVWLLKFRFFNLRFILSMAALGLAGFSIYALLPMTNGLLPGSPWNLYHAWADSLDETKNVLVSVYRGFWVSHRMITLAVMLFFLMPPLAFLLRFGDDDTKNKSPLDQAMIRFFRGIRVGLLLLGVWLAFDAIFGPRQVVARQMHVTLPLLTFDYLNALGVGFLAGNLLLIQGHDASRRRRTFFRQLAQWLESATVPSLTLLLAVAVLGLSARNLPAIVLVNRQPLVQFGQLALQSLPPGGGIVLSDFPELLEVFQAAQARAGGKRDWLPVDVESLPVPEYRKRLERMRAGSWLMPTNRQNLMPAEMLQLVDRLAQTNRLFYLHPSFGYFFERFYKQPTGSIFELKRFLTNSINPPLLTAVAITQNEKILDEFTPQFESLQPTNATTESPLVKSAEKIFRLEKVAPNQSEWLKEWYSMALDSWGVDLQRNGQLPAAERRFAQALSLNTNNWVARINLFCNTNLQAGNKMDVTSAAGFASQIGSVEKLVSLIGHLGPLDDPGFCYLLGNVFQQSGLPRQAMQQFDRASELAPGVLAPQFELARLAARFGMPDRAMEWINQIHDILKTRPADANMDTQLALLEAGVWLSQTNVNRAVGVLQTVVQQHPDDARMLNRISQAYLAIGYFTNAELLVTQLLHREPDDISALMMQSQIFLQTSRAELAIPVLNRVLSFTNTPDAKLTRAMAYVQTGNLAAAKADCLELDNSMTNCFLAEYWLAHIAGLQHDTNQSIHYLQLCLTNAPPQTPIWREARARLQALKPDSVVN
jgi:tetratricopeptide (TPR) repeat protein